MTPWTSPEFDDHEQVVAFSDPATGLRAIVAVHSTALGPAAGGTRFRAYTSDDDALADALRLSRAMSYKSALAELPLGGGKAVILGDPAKLKTPALLHAYGRFLNRIGATFATGEDVGISEADCMTVREVSPFVGGTAANGPHGDPSGHTAVGVLHGLRATARRRLGARTLAGLHVAVQGLGAVGARLAELLHADGARLTVADVRAEAVARVVTHCGAAVAPTDTIHRTPADVFAPCALGGVFTPATVAELGAPAVAGAANNQLASAEAGRALARRGVLYAPDYVINAGGIVSGLEELTAMPGRTPAPAEPLPARLAAIGPRLEALYARAEAEGATPEMAADRVARERIGRAR